MPKKSEISYTPNDKPIKEQEKDKLQVSERIVKKILNFLDDSPETSLTVAITGEWGIGKTSVMNLLEKNLNKDIVIRFEPLLEGKLELLEIMELFYLKLYTSLKAEISNARDIFTKILSNLVAIPVTGTTVRLSPHPFVKLFSPIDISVELDCGKVANTLLKAWESNDRQSFLQATKDLNTHITEKN